jgi:hypothetical protein
VSPVSARKRRRQLALVLMWASLIVALNLALLAGAAYAVVLILKATGVIS